MITRSHKRAVSDMSNDDALQNDNPLQTFFQQVAAHNIVDDLSSQVAVEKLQDRKIPALCSFTQEVGIDSNNCFTLFGRAYTRTKLVEWIRGFIDKTEMPTCPDNRAVISDQDLELLGFELTQFRAYRLRELSNSIVKRRVVEKTTKAPPNSPIAIFNLFDCELFSRTSDLQIGAVIFESLRNRLEPLWSAESTPVHLLQYYLTHFDDLLCLAIHTANFPIFSLLLGVKPREFPWSKILSVMLGEQKPQPLSGFCDSLFRECNVTFQTTLIGVENAMCIITLLQSYANIARLHFTVDTALTAQVFEQSQFQNIFESLTLTRFTYDTTLPEFANVVAILLSTTRDVFPAQLTCRRVLQSIFEYVCKCNSVEMFTVWTQIVGALSLSTDYLKRLVELWAKYDAISLFPDFERWLTVKCEQFVFPLDVTLFIAVQNFSQHVASTLFQRKLKIQSNDDSFADLIQHAIESGNAVFLSTSYDDAIKRVSNQNRTCLMEIAVKCSTIAIVEIVVRQEQIANVVEWCDLLDTCPVDNVDTYNLLWETGVKKFLIDVTRENWLTVCNACYGCLLASLRRSNYRACMLWFETVPSRFFENQFHEMLLNACRPDSEVSHKVFDALVRTRNKRLRNAEYDYYFNSGTLLIKASIVGASYIVKHVLRSANVCLTTGRWEKLICDCLLHTVKQRHWSSFEMLFRKARECETFRNSAFQNILVPMLQPFSDRSDAEFLRVVVALNAY